jgi:hypothetical protein
LEKGIDKYDFECESLESLILSRITPYFTIDSTLLPLVTCVAHCYLCASQEHTRRSERAPGVSYVVSWFGQGSYRVSERWIPLPNQVKDQRSSIRALGSI